MVDLTRPVMNGVDFKDYYKRPDSTHSFVDIVLLDKTTTPLEPCLYQLNDPQHATDDFQAFTRLGEIVSFDSHKKLIILANDNMVTYQHMIIASGSKSSWMNPMPTKEFAAGVQILMKALRLQERKPSVPLSSLTTGKIKTSKSKTSPTTSMPKPKAQEQTNVPTKDPKRVYQVQL